MQEWTLTVDNVVCDLPLNFYFERILQVADIRTVDLRTSNISSTFTLEKTKANNIALGYPYDVDSADAISRVNTKTAILDDGIQYLVGKLSITNYAEGYECEFFNGNRDWMNELKGKKVNELDFSEYNIPYTITDIQVSYAYTTPYVLWDLCDRGGFNLFHGYPSVYDRFPMFQLYAIILKIFENIGWSINSSFINGTYFKKKYLLHTWSDRLVNSEDERVKSRVTVLFFNGSAVIEPNLFYQIFFTGGLPSNLDYIYPTYTAYIRAANPFRAYINITLVGSSLTTGVELDVAVNIYIGAGVNITYSTSLYFHFTNDIEHFTLKTDTFDWDASMLMSMKIISPGGIFELDVGSTIDIIPVNEVCQGEVIDMNLQLPPDMLQQDFITMLKTKYNLFFEPDNDLRVLTIEPYIDFVLPTANAIDITSLVQKDTQAIEYPDVPAKIVFDQADDSADTICTDIKSRQTYNFGFEEISQNTKIDDSILLIKSLDSPVIFQGINLIDWRLTVPVLRKTYPAREFSNKFGYKIVDYCGTTTTAGSIKYLKKATHTYASGDAVTWTFYATVIYFPILSTEYYSDHQVNSLNDSINPQDNLGLFARWWIEWTRQSFSKILSIKARLNKTFFANFTHRNTVIIKDDEYGYSEYYVNKIITNNSDFDLSEMELVKIVPRITPIMSTLLRHLDGGKINQNSQQLMLAVGSSGQPTIVYGGAEVFSIVDGAIKINNAAFVYAEDINGNIVPVFTEDIDGNYSQVLF